MVRGRYGEDATNVFNDASVATETSGKAAIEAAKVERVGRGGREEGRAGSTQIPRRADTKFTDTNAMVPSRPPKPNAALR